MVSSRKRQLLNQQQKSIVVPRKSDRTHGFSRDYPLGFQTQDLENSKAGAAGAFSFVPEVENCLDSIVGAIKKLPWNIVRYPTGMRRENNRVVQGETLASNNDLQTRHPLQRAITRFQDLNNFDLMGVIAFDYTLYGTVAFEVATNDFGYNPKLEWLNPLGLDVYAPAGKIDWFRFGWNNQYVNIAPEDVAYLHNRDTYNDFVGRPRVLSAMEKINIIRNLDRFLRDYFFNNARPTLIISPADAESDFSDADFEIVKRDFRDTMKGVNGQYNTWVTQRAINATPLEQPDITKNNSISKEESDAIYEKFSVPRALRGNTATTAYKESGVVQRFMLDAVIPLALTIQEFINIEFMPHYNIEYGHEVFEFDTSAWDTVTAADQLEEQIVSSQVSAGYVTLATAQRIQERPIDKQMENRYLFRGLPMMLTQVDRLIEAEIAIAVATAQAPPPPGGAPLQGNGAGLAVGSSLGNREDEFLQRRLDAPKKSKFSEADVERDEGGQFAEQGGSDSSEEDKKPKVVISSQETFETALNASDAWGDDGKLNPNLAEVAQTYLDSKVGTDEWTELIQIIQDSGIASRIRSRGRGKISEMEQASKFSEADINRDESGQFADKPNGGDGADEEEGKPEEEEATEETVKPISKDKVREQRRPPVDAIENGAIEEWSSSLTDSEGDAISGWSIKDYGRFGSLGRGETTDFEGVEFTPEVKQRFTEFETAVESAPIYTGTSWRGLSLEGDKDSIMAEYTSNIGKSMVFDTYSSASANVEIAGNFSGAFGSTGNIPVIFEINSNKGHYIAPATQSGHDSPFTEQEVLFQPNTEFKVQNVFIGKYGFGKIEAIFVVMGDN